ncbi:MAG: InlB B-repeat-containing protein [Clostridiales bacterium]|nr:InlB B-repeat-containing protein [Clostridiales bacterium]
MKLSRPTRDRLIAATAALIVLVVVFGVVLLAKSCATYTVTFYDDIGSTQVLFTEKVSKGDQATNRRPESEDNKQFDCWVTEDGKEFNFSTPIEGDLKLYAKWLE